MARGALSLWSPLREMERMRRGFDDLFERLVGEDAFMPWKAGLNVPAVESYVEGDKLVVRADLPGIDPKDVEVTVTGNMLTIKGSREQKREEKGRDFIHRELSYGAFERSLTLPQGVKADAIKASYQNGVLELAMPAPKELSAHKVPIKIEAVKEGQQKQEKQEKTSRA